MEDPTLIAQFESRELPFELWSHRLHVRVAYLFLRRDPFEVALRKFRSALQAYIELHGVPSGLTEGYHETVTVAWMMLIAARMRDSDPSDSESFCNAHSELDDRKLLRRFYSSEHITTWEAKRAFVAPDLQPLPSAVRRSQHPNG